MPAAIKLESVTGDSVESTEEIVQLESGSLTIGRDPENGVVVDSEAVSRNHGCIIEAGSYWVYTDFGSTNGSWVNDTPVRQDQLRLIRDGDILQISNLPIRITAVDSASYSRATGGAEPILIVFKGDQFQFESKLSIAHSRFLIGPADADLVVESGLDKPIEIVLHRNTNRVELGGGGAVSPVLVNERVVGGTVSLVDRDVVSVGNYSIILCDTRTQSSGQSARAVVGSGGDGRRGTSGGGSAAAAPLPHAYAGKNTADPWQGGGPAGGPHGGGHSPGEIRSRGDRTGRYVFGGSHTDNPVSGPSMTRTQSLPTQGVAGQKFNYGTFDRHPSQRMLDDGAAEYDEDTEGGNDQLKTVLGVVVLALLAAVILVALTMF